MKKEYDAVTTIRQNIKKSKNRGKLSDLFKSVCCAYDVDTTKEIVEKKMFRKKLMKLENGVDFFVLKLF